MFHTLLYQPLFNTLVIFYNSIAFGDLGVAVILLTILIRLILFPLFYKSLRQQAVMQRIQPHVKKIQEEHKHDRETQAKALMALYKEHRINPFTSFFLLLVQLPVLIALYQVFLNGFSPETFKDLYSFVAVPPEIHNMFLGLIDLGKPYMLVVGLATVAQYFQAKLAFRKSALTEQNAKNPAMQIGKQMMYMGPLLTFVFLLKLPSVIGLYWTTTSLFSVVQQVLINRSFDQEHHGTISGKSKNNS